LLAEVAVALKALKHLNEGDTLLKWSGAGDNGGVVAGS